MVYQTLQLSKINRQKSIGTSEFTLMQNRLFNKRRLALI